VTVTRPPRAAVAAALALAFLLGALPAAAQFAPGPQYGGRGFGKNKVQYRDFDWKIYHSTHFDVYYYTAEEGLLEKVVSFAESAYDRLSREFDHQIQEPTPLIFYESHAAFEQNNIILNFIPEGIGAFATPVRFRMVLPVDLPDRELMNLIEHELTHIFQYHILFRGSLGKALTANPPTWLIEGMASYMAKDESARDVMFLRDAAVNDYIPPITQWQGGGFLAYRIGHAVLDYIEETYGRDGFMDFLFEYRNTIGSNVGRAVERAFGVDPEEFDTDFRRWLRRKYLPALLETGEPRDFGRPFRVERGIPSQETSPAASPSGDLVAAFSSERGDVDISLFDAKNRRHLRNLTRGYTQDYQYLVAQELTLGRGLGNDLDFSPDGNAIAVFAKRERSRALFLIDVLNGSVRRRYDLDRVDQHSSPAFSPDGRTVAFQAVSRGQSDIYMVDLETGELTNFTNDEIYDGAPEFSPDGSYLVVTSEVDEGTKLFRVPLDDPGRRFQLTYGESNENDPVFSPTGRRLYFTSDRADGIENIWGLDFDSGELTQYTNAVTGCFMPTVLRQADSTERLVYNALWKGRFDLYVTDVPEPVGPPEQTQIGAMPAAAADLPRFLPDIQVPIDDSNVEDYGGWRMFLEGADSFVGVNDDQTIVGRIVLSFSDYLGDKRLIADLSSVESFSNFEITYVDLSDRLQWLVSLFDYRDFYLSQSTSGDIDRERQAIAVTGAQAALIYPTSFKSRFELGAGYLVQKADLLVAVNPFTGEPVFQEFDLDFPFLVGGFTNDSTVFSSAGPISGRRLRIDTQWAPDLDESGTLNSSVDLDLRQYIPLTRRSNFALRLFAGAAEGNRPTPIYFGGLDTVRGFEFREFAGTRGFFVNAEFRFPLIDRLETPLLGFEGIRGVVFADVGGAWYDEFEEFDLWDSENSQFDDARAAYGFGVSARFLGLPVNWDFAKQYRFDGAEEGYATSFWIGTRF
jgi:Tol biopolymer transport system component